MIMDEKAVNGNHLGQDKISPEFVLSSYSVVLKTLKDEEVPEARTSLQGLIRQLIYVIPTEERFFNSYVARCLSQCSQDERDVERIKASFLHLQTYCENLVKMFWKKEVKIIKRHTGLYKNLLDMFPDVDRFMEDMGYYLDHQTDTLVLKRHDILDMKKVMKLGFDWFMTQVILEYLEDIFNDLKHDGYSWKQVTKDGIRFVGTEQECLKWFRENVPPETNPLPAGSQKRLKTLKTEETVNHSKKNGRGTNEDLYVDMKGATRGRLPHEGVDPSYVNVEKWLKDSSSSDYHLRQLEHHKEVIRQREMAQQEEEQRRKYSDMKKYHQPGEVTCSYGEKLKFDPIDDDAEKRRVGKTSPNARKKVAAKREELPVAVPKSHTRDRRGVNNSGASSSAVSNGSISSRGTSSRDSKKTATNVPTNNADYLKFLEGGSFTLDGEDEDLYSDVPRTSKQPLKAESFVMVDKRGVRQESQRQTARPLSALRTRQFAHETGLRDGFDNNGSHISGTFEHKVPDVYSIQRTQEDHMKNSLSALGLESEASSMEAGFDEWYKDYKERNEAAKENKHLDLDWGRYKNFEAAAQDYLGNQKTDAFSPEGKDPDLFDFDIPSIDIRRPPGASDFGIGEIPVTEKLTELDSNVQSDGNLRNAKPVVPSMGVTARSVSLLDRPNDMKRAASSRNSVNLPVSDAMVIRAGQFSTYKTDSNRRMTLASQAAGADFTRPEYAQILNDSLRGDKRNSIQNRSTVSNSKSLTGSLKQNREQSLKYNTLPSSSSMWRCNNCDKINPVSASDICMYCMRGREYIPQWQCLDCTFLNPANTNVCIVCDKSRTKGSEKTPLQVRGRECSKCTYINSTDAKKCEMCQEPLIVYAIHI